MINHVAPPSSSFYVHSLPFQPDIPNPPQLYAGHLSAVSTTPNTEDIDDAHLFFILAKAKHIAERERLIIWFNGGPGCSSEDGMFMEIGPWRVTETGKLTEAVGAWNEYANVLFIDQPAGTGFSYVNHNDDIRELPQAADQVLTFLRNFYDVFPEYEKAHLYLAGESYAGQYIPYIADAIRLSTLVQPPLMGLIIGNGWFDPVTQYPSYLSSLQEMGIIKSGSREELRVQKTVLRCQAAMEAKGDSLSALEDICETVLGAVEGATKKQGLCMSAYNVKVFERCGTEFPPALKWVKPYLDTEDVAKALHANHKLPAKWEQCNNTVSEHFWSPHSPPSVKLLPTLLQSMKILLFVGDQDLMCNWAGIRNMVDRLEWGGSTGWSNASKEAQWRVEDRDAGTWREERGLSLVRIFGAGHMVPMDLPTVAQDMLLRFIGIDPLVSAGPASTIPSRIGDGDEVVLGAFTPNGSSVAVAAPASSESVTTGNVEQDTYYKAHEAYYGPRRTLTLLFVIFIVGGGFVAFLRWRVAKRREKKERMYARLPLKSRRVEESEGEALMREEEAFAIGDTGEPEERLVESPKIDEVEEGRKRTVIVD
ncbi:alpha/beta-hydrolase [Atractiella rhizophila]|nr:alpha/beta-hydrolase [Atractiella rhizophila]